MQTIRTMIVDDEARIRRGIERLVMSCGEGWEVVATAGDGIEALQYMKESEGAVDLLITDVKMPEMDGLTLIRKAREQYAVYPLVISGYDDFPYVQTALREGALDYLLKPVNREQFRERMADIRAKIVSSRRRALQWGELEKQAARHKESRQTRTLAAMTSADLDLASVGYWVDEFPKGRYVLSCIRLDTIPVKARSYTAKDWKAYYYALENMIGEVVSASAPQGTDRQAWCWKGSDADFWTLLHSSDPEFDIEEETFQIAENIRSAIRTYTPFSVSVSFGAPFDDLYLLPEAKRQAMNLMNYRLIYGENRIFRSLPEKQDALVVGSADCSGMQPEHFQSPQLSALAQQLKRSVEQANAVLAGKLSGQLFDKLERLESPERMQSVLQNVVILLHSARLESRDGIARASAVERDLHQVKTAANLAELKRHINRQIGEAIREIEESRSSAPHAKPVEQAKEWIKEHLGQDLTIKKIADQVHMNPTYFCEIFKMQTGETILDYLTGRRIEKAKDLLRDTELKLQEVSRLVGYHDVKYFSRLFKMWTGQTPSHYRESAGS